VKQVLPVFERALDQHGLCRAWQLQATSDWTRGLVSVAAEAWERAAEHARLAGEEHQRADILCWLASSAWLGAMPVDAGVRRCEEIRVEVAGHPASEAEVLRPLGGLHGFAGRFDLARSLFSKSNAAFDELGIELYQVVSHPEAIVEMLAGEFAVAELWLRRAYDVLEAKGENYFRSTTAALLGRAILAQGRDEEAEEFSNVSAELAEPHDLFTQIVWRGVRARILAARSHFDDAERLSREAVALAERTELVNDRADALTDLASVLEASGRSAEAATAVRDALELYEQKGNVVSADAARERLDLLAAV
jgi:tetratricopeptide (TPR) repeat protein